MKKQTKVKSLPVFDKKLKRFSKKFYTLKSDFQKLIESLEIEPIQGIPLGSNLYKIRLGTHSKGGGKRVGLGSLLIMFRKPLMVILFI